MLLPKLPKTGTLERVVLEKLLQKPEGVTFLDFVGTDITEENLEQIITNLREGNYEEETC